MNQVILNFGIVILTPFLNVGNQELAVNRGRASGFVNTATFTLMCHHDYGSMIKRV